MNSIVFVTLSIIQLAQGQNIAQFFQHCHKNSPQKDFDHCLLGAVNQLNVFFKTGLPDYHVAPFDPHHSNFIELRRGDAKGIAGFKLFLSKVSEYGWTESNVTDFRTDIKNDRIVYSQYFPVKSLDGNYDFSAKILGQPINTMGVWNLTLYDYRQTTSITRTGGPGSILKVRIEVDEIKNMQLHISDFFNGRKALESAADFLINTFWQPGLPFLKPLINELVSTAFTDIFTESFRFFPLSDIIQD